MDETVLLALALLAMRAKVATGAEAPAAAATMPPISRIELKSSKAGPGPHHLPLPPHPKHLPPRYHPRPIPRIGRPVYNTPVVKPKPILPLQSIIRTYTKKPVKIEVLYFNESSSPIEADYKIYHIYPRIYIYDNQAFYIQGYNPRLYQASYSYSIQYNKYYIPFSEADKAAKCKVQFKLTRNGKLILTNNTSLWGLSQYKQYHENLPPGEHIYGWKAHTTGATCNTYNIRLGIRVVLPPKG
ncbi:MAG: hypothetical protein GSR72_00290 [Desulfurococcales archaeon]|nr:hypothetical protein [Desulfurococcales archaeon]